MNAATTIPQKQSAEVRQHRLEKRVARLRISRPASLTGGQMKNGDNGDDGDDGDDEQPGVKRARRGQEANQNKTDDTNESFVPSQAPATESEKLKAAQSRDRVWITEYWIELSLILLGLNVGPLLYYYFVARAPDGGASSSMETGVSFVDHWTRHLAAPVQDARYWFSRDNLPSTVSEFARDYAALLALLASLAATMALLWNKAGLLQSLANLSKMQAAPIVHVAIAWSWLSAMFAFTFGNAVGWTFNFTWTLVGYVAVILFSHTFAGLAQAALYGYLLYLFSGLGKRVETGSFSVDVPDPDSIASSSSSGAAAAVRGGAGGMDMMDDATPNDLELAALFGGPQQYAFAPPEVPEVPEIEWARGGSAMGDALATAASSWGTSAAATATTALTNATSSVPSSSSSALSAALASSLAAADDSVPGVAASTLPAYEPMPQVRDGFLANANRGAYQASKITNELTLGLFAVVKIANANMQTPAGNLFALAANGLLLAGSIGTAAYRLRSSYVASSTIPW